MFQPMAPNFLLSCTIAWKKEKAKISFLYSSGLRQSLRAALSNVSIVYMMLLLRPDGGSMVILTEFCKTETGKAGVGMEVIQMR